MENFTHSGAGGWCLRTVGSSGLKPNARLGNISPAAIWRTKSYIELRSVCIGNPNPNVVAMKSAKDGVQFDASGPLNMARDRRIFVQRPVRPDRAGLKTLHRTLSGVSA